MTLVNLYLPNGVVKQYTNVRDLSVPRKESLAVLKFTTERGEHIYTTLPYLVIQTAKQEHNETT